MRWSTARPSGSPSSLEQVTADDVREYFEVNDAGHVSLLPARWAAHGQSAHGRSDRQLRRLGHLRPYPDHAAYFPSKGAIPTLTRTFAVEFGRRNPRVRVNAMLPGPILFADDPTDNNVLRRREAIEGTLVRRAGTGQDIAQAVIFLLENTFVTGVCLPVDGGRSVYAPTGDDLRPAVE